MPPLQCLDVFDESEYANMFDGEVSTCEGPVKRLRTILSSKDRLGSLLVRLGINRKSYKFPPGLYAIGNPDENSPALVTANYKLTVDTVRSNIGGIDSWLLVINTSGVNVWCAAGKGSFGSDEIIYRIKATGLYKISKSKLLVLPQLGAPGVNPQKISKYTRFKTIYGPVRAGDIKSFFENEFKASAGMRRVTFSLSERMILSPVEVMLSAKYMLAFLFMFTLLNYVDNSTLGLTEYINNVWLNTSAYVFAILTACILFPALLPVLPFRSFSAKGGVLGSLYSAAALSFPGAFMYSGSMLSNIGHFMCMTCVIGFFSLNFTGSTNFTSLSGVQKETLWSAPVFAICFITGIMCLFIERLV
ncbi:CO dehydrogenase/acetyl-CoA synthase delta subunit [Peptoclostridium litorale DSM 5388]|uniref:Carbon monoxide dehydrogenase corrinoid n=2 Tax=Peptoclostridium litorale TaxID=1557 RepID=A0A069RKC8_PEPLI|nr:carbon monoxide dehydrogenase corrinoid [Peptoclostridium litorale DSM 5388]SIN68872.1 CO dehydrogenase/acetyl-CoA synthase delta subunit [Peptoclostridium litorale DSM 5388]